jgi:hypothetical protein
MTARLRSALLLVPVLCASCSSSPDEPSGEPPPPAGGQTGEETLGCLPVERQTLEVDEPSALGMSARAVLDSLGTEREATFRWSAGPSTTLRIALGVRAGAIEFQTRQWRDSGSGAEGGAELAAAECNDGLLVPVNLTFETADGAFAETWPVTLDAESAASATVFHRVILDALVGTFQIADLDPVPQGDIAVYLQLAFRQGVLSGSVSGNAANQSGSGPDATASARFFSVGTF